MTAPSPPQGTPPPVVICVRRTIDWRDPRAVAAELKEELRPKVETWNAMFTMPYHEFRQRAKEIAEINLTRVTDAAVVAPGSIPPGALVVPVDDDDWFAPDLVRHLHAAWSADRSGWYWTRFVLEARPAFQLRALLGMTWRSEHDRFRCGTNNYAVIGDGEWLDAIAGHARASRLFERELTRTTFIPRMMSIQNRNVSSQTVLGWRKPGITPATLRRRFRRYRQLYVHARLPNELAWATPYVQLMHELMREVKPRR